MPPARPERLLAFDVDCGELARGHRVIARGLTYEGRSTDDLTSGDQSGHQELPMVSLAYEVVPGLTAAEAAFQIEATYTTDVPLPWSTSGAGFGPRSTDEYAGGPATRGAAGPWPLPEGARHLHFMLHRAGSQGAPDRRLGSLDVDLTTGTALWAPAEDPAPEP
jgi:hypothetical protein